MLLEPQHHDDAMSFQFHMEPEPGAQDSKAGPRTRILQGPAPPPILVPESNSCDASPENTAPLMSPSHLNNMSSPFLPGSIQTSLGAAASSSTSPKAAASAPQVITKSSPVAADASSGHATPSYRRSTSSGRSTPSHKLPGAVSMGTAPPDTIPRAQFSPTMSPKSPRFPSSLPTAGFMFRAPEEDLLSQSATSPRSLSGDHGGPSRVPRPSRSSLDETRFSYVVRKSGRWSGAGEDGVAHAHSAGTAFELAAPSLMQEVLEGKEEQEEEKDEGEEGEIAIMRPAVVCEFSLEDGTAANGAASSPPDLPPVSLGAPGSGRKPPLPGVLAPPIPQTQTGLFPPPSSALLLSTGPSSSEPRGAEPSSEPPVAKMTGFYVPERPPPALLPPPGPPLLGPSASSPFLGGSVGQRAATMWGSAMDLVGLASQSSSAPRCPSDEDLAGSGGRAPSVGSVGSRRGALSEEMGADLKESKSHQSLSGVHGNRVSSLSDLLSLMWKDSASSSSSAASGTPAAPSGSSSSSSKQQQQQQLQTPPLPGRPSPLRSHLSPAPAPAPAPASADRALGSGPRRPSWRGLRHKEASPRSSRTGSGGIDSGVNQGAPRPLPPPSSLLANKHHPLAKAKGTLGKARTPSAPNLEALDMSRLVTDAGHFHNLNRFEAVYRMTESLGTGGYAVVRKCIHHASRKEYAVKVMQLNTLEEEMKGKGGGEDEGEEGEEEEDDDDDKAMTLREIINELSMMCKLNHPNIITIHEFFIQDGHCFIVMQLLEGAELMDALVELGEAEGKLDGGTGSYSEKDVRTVMGSLIDAVSYMHERGITHRDIKLENLVLAKAGDLSSVVIVDFGLAKAARAREKMEETCGTPWYSSPELLRMDPYTQATDLWSLGVAMFVLLCGDFPFDNEDEDELMDLIIDGDYQMSGPKWDIVSTQAKDLIHGLLQTKPTKRLTAVEAIEHPWFTGEIEQHAAAGVLHHAHMRLSRLVECAPGRLPVAVFAPGEWITKQGERGKEVYMILEGEAEVLRDCEPGEKDCPPSNVKCDPAMYAGFIKVRTLRKGNFAGVLAHSLIMQQMRPGSNEVSRQNSLKGRRSSSGSGGSSRWSEAQLEDALQMAAGAPGKSPIGIPIPEEPEREGLSPGLTSSQEAGAFSLASSAFSDLSDLSSQAASTANTSPSDASHLAMAQSSESRRKQQGGGWVNTALRGIGVVTKLIRLRRNWVGHRRIASIRAVTQVKALVLNREDMQWAVEHDYRLTHELQDAMKAQRKKMRAKAREAKKLKVEQQQQQQRQQAEQ